MTHLTPDLPARSGGEYSMLRKTNAGGRIAQNGARRRRLRQLEVSMSETELSGGCQCGAVRYEITQAPRDVHFCHCRMCQRASGNVFAALAPVRKTALRWLAEEPAEFASSTVARRSFCRHCGTPISFAYNESEWTCLTLGSFDDPEQVPPTIEYGVESRLSYIHPREQCAQKETGNGYLANMINQQA